MTQFMDIPTAIAIARPGTQWSLNGNNLDDLIWNEPTDPPTLTELEAAWQEFVSIKIWPNVQQFMGVFTMQEKAAIALSTDPTIAALRLELTTWLSEVHADDARVLAGLDRLVELEIITAQRKSELLHTQ